MHVGWKNFIGGYLNTCAEYRGDKDFMLFGDRHITWSQLNGRVNRLAAALVDMGVGKNDKVTFIVRNRPEFFEINYAIQKTGGIPVPMNYRFSAREIEFQAANSDAVIFFAEDLWLEAVQRARPRLPAIRHFICLGDGCPDDMTPYEELVSKYPAADPEIEVNEDDVCVICYTTGTTGRPKGVMLTYKGHVKLLEYLVQSFITQFSEMEMLEEKLAGMRDNIPFPGIEPIIKLLTGPLGKNILKKPFARKGLARLVEKIIANPNMIRFAPRDIIRIMTPSFPLFHDASYQLVIELPLTGLITFMQPDMVSFDPVKVFDMIERERPNFLANVPTAWKIMVDDPRIDDYDLSSVTISATGAGLNPGGLKKKILEKFSSSILIDIFGQTEMTPATAMRLDADSSSLKKHSVGKPLVQTRIVDENGCDVPAGQVGEIIYKSDTVMKGYYKEDARNSKSFKDGWFYSGDLGYFDAEGEIRILERKNECIFSGGEKIFPQEVEEVMEEHPKISKSCVIGLPDEKWGNKVRAVVTLEPGEKATEKEIIAWTRDKMAGFKRPKSVIFVEELPISTVGKIKRDDVKKKFGKP